MLITAKEAKSLIQKSSEEVLSYGEEQAISAEIRRNAEQGFCEVVLYPPSYDGSEDVSLKAKWAKAARAALVGAGYAVEMQHGGSGRSLRVAW